MTMLIFTVGFCGWAYLQDTPRTIAVEHAIYASSTACSLDWEPDDCRPSAEKAAASSVVIPPGPIHLNPKTDHSNLDTSGEWTGPFFSSHGEVFHRDKSAKQSAISTVHASRVESAALRSDGFGGHFDFREMPAGNLYKGPQHYSLKRNMGHETDTNSPHDVARNERPKQYLDVLLASAVEEPEQPLESTKWQSQRVGVWPKTFILCCRR